MKQMIAPNGRRIVGTSEVVNAVAEVKGWSNDGVPDYAGGSVVDWDSQLTRTAWGSRGQATILVVDEDGEFHAASDCKLVDE